MVYIKILASNEATKGFVFLNQTQIPLQSFLSSSKKTTIAEFFFSLKLPQLRARVICTDFATSGTVLTEPAGERIENLITFIAKTVANSVGSLARLFFVNSLDEQRIDRKTSQPTKDQAQKSCDKK